jgi:hypothetical protein
MPQGLYTKIFAVRLKGKDEPVPKGSMLLEKSLKSRRNKKIITQIMRKKSSGLSGERLVLDEPGQPVFVEIGLNGTTEVKMDRGHCIFSGLKFNTTSFNHRNAFFYLIIAVYKYEAVKNEKGKDAIELHPLVI